VSERVRAHQLPPGHYPSTTRGLAKFLQETEGLEREHAARIVRAVFGFIGTCVLTHGSTFNAYMFGTFRRAVTTRRTEPSLGVSTPHQYVMKFTASQHYGRIRMEDEE